MQKKADRIVLPIKVVQQPGEPLDQSSHWISPEFHISLHRDVWREFELGFSGRVGDVGVDRGRRPWLGG